MGAFSDVRLVKKQIAAAHLQDRFWISMCPPCVGRSYYPNRGCTSHDTRSIDHRARNALASSSPVPVAAETTMKEDAVCHINGKDFPVCVRCEAVGMTLAGSSHDKLS